MIVRLSGGLGNQFFQYAFGRAYAEKTGEELSLDTWSFYRDKLRNYELDNYNIKKGKKRFWRRVFCNIVWELKTHIGHTGRLEKLVKMECEKENFLLQEIETKDAYAVGYWHNVQYLKKIQDMLVEEFHYIGELTTTQRTLIAEMQKEKAVAMHIRRGDYLSEACSKIYVNLEKDYYKKALEYIMTTKTNVGRIYVFSDDIAWCKAEYKDLENAVFIDETISTNQYTDMELMQNCAYFIIANSTFSWWASWLSQSEGKVIVAPKNWYVNNEKNEKAINALMGECVLM